ncbi:MAG: hypothetical protein CMH52_02930, partial [Myxococcales bacterium]|nr:hypothetical protein [Myxococcales bacterium]
DVKEHPSVIAVFPIGATSGEVPSAVAVSRIGRVKIAATVSLLVYVVVDYENALVLRKLTIPKRSKTRLPVTSSKIKLMDRRHIQGSSRVPSAS